MHRRHDVAILGAGPAGCATALFLRQRTALSVALVDYGPRPSPQLGESLSPAARRALDNLNLWDVFLHDGHLQSRGTCSCWGGDALGYNDYIYSPLGPGWHLNRRRFDAMLLKKARGQGVEVFRPTEAPGWSNEPQGGYTLRLKGAEQETISARFVVDASGSRATFAAAAGARRQMADRGLGFYGLFHVRPGAVFDSYALVETCPQGWWYSALMPGDRVAVGLLGDGMSLRGLKREQPAEWLSLLRNAPATWRRLQPCAFSGQPLLAVPANATLLDRVEGGDWLAVGDAACTYDPLSSQGVLKAISSAAAATEALAQAAQGNPSGLQAYAQRVAMQFDEHLEIRRAFYGQEQRWPQAPYWKNRATAGMGRG